jgi:hypothetical protein
MQCNVKGDTIFQISPMLDGARTFATLKVHGILRPDPLG